MQCVCLDIFFSTLCTKFEFMFLGVQTHKNGRQQCIQLAIRTKAFWLASWAQAGSGDTPVIITVMYNYNKTKFNITGLGHMELHINWFLRRPKFKDIITRCWDPPFLTSVDHAHWPHSPGDDQCYPASRPSQLQKCQIQFSIRMPRLIGCWSLSADIQ